ncbi:MAG TPA: hypothetical protein VFZ34_09415 [Blastocatellia bacterium]|nr:hypothetical protein [Blastocatellia bacterium]
MLRKITITLSLILCLLLGVWSFTKPGQAVDAIPVTVVFNDSLDNNIRSDGLGAYLNGVDGVQRIIDLLNDLILQLHFAGKKTLPRRQMFFDFTKPVGNALNRGTILEAAFLNVDSIGTMAVGESRSAQAQFNTSIGLLRFNPANYPGTSYVLVTRTSETTWEITASASTGGDVAALVQQARNGTYKPVGNYHMPFQITVQLP